MAHLKRSQLGLKNKKGAGRPFESPKIQINRRVPFLQADQFKLLLDNMLVDPALIPVLLAATKDHIAQRQAHSRLTQGIDGN